METTLSPHVSMNVAAPPTTPRARWFGRVLSAVPILFLTFDVAMKLAHHPAVAEASARLGLPQDLAPVVASILAICLALHVVPRTAVLGAVLLTGYLGGAVLVHLRVGDPLFSHTLFPVYIGALLWAGLFLRDARVRNFAFAR